MKIFLMKLKKTKGKRTNSRLYGDDHRLSNNAGFTLVEVVISLTIVSLIMVIIFSLLKLSYSSREKVERVITDTWRKRISNTVLSRQVSSYFPYPMDADPSGATPFFVGRPQSMSFVTSYSISFGSDAGIILARYTIKDDDDAGCRLDVFEDVIQNLDTEKPEEYYKNKTITVMKSDKKLRFKFFDKKSGTWLDEWAVYRQSAPDMVMINEVVDSAGATSNAPFKVIPIHATMPANVGLN